MGGPGGGGDQVAVGVGVVEGGIGGDELAAGQLDLGPASRIGAHAAALDHAGGRKQLRPVADGGDRLLHVGEVPHDLQHAGRQPQIFRRTAAGNDQGVVRLLVDLVERGIEPEIVAPLLAVGLLAFEVVNGRGDVWPAFLPGQTACTSCPTISSIWNGTITS